MTYFSDRERGPAPRIRPDIPQAAWGGIVAVIDSLAGNGALGIDFPDECPDGRGPVGTHSHNLGLALQAEIPELMWPLRAGELPPTLAILDLLEFTHRHVAEPIQDSFHSFFGHYHLNFDRNQGQQDFRARVNRILERNGIAFELGDDGLVRRLAAPALQELLSQQAFATGDSTLDALLEAARTKFLNPDAQVRREALEKLWDAWERIKTLEPGANKKASTRALLDKAATEPEFRSLLENEASSLTAVGNTFRIRHAETNQVELQTEDHVDYLFHRMFALVWMLLRAR